MKAVSNWADLGLAKKVGDESASTMAGSILGTPNYIAPEQAVDSRGADSRSDIYTLGATLYHLVTGTLPFEADSSYSVMSMHNNEPLDPPQNRKPDLPADLCDVICKMMEKSPEGRFPDCKQLLRELKRIKSSYQKDSVLQTTCLRKRRIKYTTKVDLPLNKPVEQADPKKKILVIGVSIVAALILSILVIINQQDKEQSSIGMPEKKSATQQVVKSKDISAETLEEVKDNQSTELKEKDLLSLINLRKKFRETVKIEDGVLTIKPSKKNFYVPITSDDHSDFKLIVEYKCFEKMSKAMISIHERDFRRLDIMLSSKKRISTGSFYPRQMEITVKGKTYSVEPLNILHKHISRDWMKMEIICEGNKVTVSVNGNPVSECLTEFASGGIGFQVLKGDGVYIRRLSLVELIKN